jgi:hypothetical protein
MDDALFVRVSERADQLRDQQYRDLRVERLRAFVDVLAQRATFDQLGDDVRFFGVRPRIIEDLQDARVMKLRDRDRFAMKTFPGIGLAREELVEDFDGDDPRKLFIAGAVDDAHPALAELAEDLVSFELGTAQHYPPNSMPN